MAQEARKTNGQAFVLHIWDSTDCRIDPQDREWSCGWMLIDYLTHRVGPITRGLAAKMEWLAYIDSF